MTSDDFNYVVIAVSQKDLVLADTIKKTIEDLTCGTGVRHSVSFIKLNIDFTEQSSIAWQAALPLQRKHPELDELERRVKKPSRGLFLLLGQNESRSFYDRILFSPAVQTPQALAKSAEGVIGLTQKRTPSVCDSFAKTLRDAATKSRIVLILTGISHEELINVQGEPFPIEVFHTTSHAREYVLATIGRDIYKIQFPAEDRFHLELIKQICPDLKDMRDLKELRSLPSCSKNLIEKEHRDWFAQEFGSYDPVGRIFIDVCTNSLIDFKIDPSIGMRSLPWEINVAFGALRMARRLSTWTLEGYPFECVVVLTSRSKEELIEENQTRFISLIELEPCSFNFSNLGLVRQYAEMAQGTSLLMIVSARDGKLHCVAVSRSNQISYRHFREIAGGASVVFRVRPQGRVDFFDSTGLKLLHDGFEWQESPIDFLKDVVSSHFSTLSPDFMLKCIDCLMESVQLLLDSSKSSILVLVNDKDRAIANKFCGEPLRKGIASMAGEVRVKIDDLDPTSLTSLLQLDGAHFIDSSGKMYAIARRIPTAATPRHKIKLSQVEGRFLMELNKNVPQKLKLIQDQKNSNWLVFDEFIRLEQLEYFSELFSENQEIFQKLKKAVVSEYSQISKLLFLSVNDVDIRQISSQLTKNSVYCTAICRRSICVSDSTPNSAGLLVWKDQGNDFKNEAVPKKLVLKVREKQKIEKQFGGEFENPDPYFFYSPWPVLASEKEDMERIEGLAMLPSGRFLVYEKNILQVLEDAKLPRSAFLILDQWYRFGVGQQSDSSGTGTRAAEELSRSLPNSIVVKVSASGSIKALQKGVLLGK
ncbi:MAG: hypothetical protein KF851_10845 [Pirellulaceae bacterium]|nr:hypothetical protein [Pirellulaceae bacterium]